MIGFSLRIGGVKVLMFELFVLIKQGVSSVFWQLTNINLLVYEVEAGIYLDHAATSNSGTSSVLHQRACP